MNRRQARGSLAPSSFGGGEVAQLGSSSWPNKSRIWQSPARNREPDHEFLRAVKDGRPDGLGPMAHISPLPDAFVCNCQDQRSIANRPESIMMVKAIIVRCAGTCSGCAATERCINR